MTVFEVIDSLPGIIMLAGGAVLPLFPARLRPVWFLFPPILAFAAVCRMQPDATLAVPFLAYDLVLVRVDSLSLAFAYVFTVMAFLGGVYGFHLKDGSQQAAALVYAGAALGVTFAGDWLTLYVFWEIMAVSSVWLVWSAHREISLRAGMRYLLFHLLGGMMLLAGILWHLTQTGSLTLTTPQGGAAWLILFGFAVNAAIPPLHMWLVDAYPEATVTGAVFLSAFTTKTAVYVLARTFPGWEILVAGGAVMCLYGVVFAFLENNIRRILAYHILSQVGYMVVAIGLGTDAGIAGATAHAIANILYKGQLFMATGAVLYATGRQKLSDLGGLSRDLPGLLVLYIIAAMAISGFPLLSGFVSKSLVTHAAELEHREGLALLLQVAAVGTFLSVGLKLPYFAWFGQRPPLSSRPLQLPFGMYLAMALLAAMNVAMGIAPDLLYRILPHRVEYEPYTALHVIQVIELLGFTGLVFWLVRGRILPKAALTLDLDWFYRRPGPWLWRHVVLRVDWVFAIADRATMALTRTAASVSRDPVLFSRGLRRAGETPERVGYPPTYDPDRYRGPVGTLVLSVLLGFVLAMSWTILTSPW